MCGARHVLSSRLRRVLGLALALACGALSPPCVGAQTVSPPHPLEAAALLPPAPALPLTAARRGGDGRRGYPARIHWLRTATFTAAAGLATALTEPPRDARWTGSILFDDSLRCGLLAGSGSGRRTADDISDGLQFVPLLPLVLLDPFLAKGWGERAALLVNAWESVMATQLLTVASKNAVGRERPFGPECASDAGYDRDCGSREHNASFFSGHTSRAFTFAGLTCANHWHGRMYGTRWVDSTICGVAVAAATATGLLRIVADKHWSTDVLAGATVGYLSGYFMHWPPRPGPRRLGLPLRAAAAGDFVGLAYVRRF